MALALQRKERKFWLLQATRVSQKGVSRRGAEAEVEEAEAEATLVVVVQKEMATATPSSNAGSANSMASQVRVKPSMAPMTRMKTQEFS